MFRRRDAGTDLAFPLVFIVALEALLVEDDESPVGELLHPDFTAARRAPAAEQLEEAAFMHDDLSFTLQKRSSTNHEQMRV